LAHFAWYQKFWRQSQRQASKDRASNLLLIEQVRHRKRKELVMRYSIGPNEQCAPAPWAFVTRGAQAHRKDAIKLLKVVSKLLYIQANNEAYLQKRALTLFSVFYGVANRFVFWE
jgi:hypothetical protein